MSERNFLIDAEMSAIDMAVEDPYLYKAIKSAISINDIISSKGSESVNMIEVQDTLDAGVSQILNSSVNVSGWLRQSEALKEKYVEDVELIFTGFSVVDDLHSKEDPDYQDEVKVTFVMPYIADDGSQDFMPYFAKPESVLINLNEHMTVEGAEAYLDVKLPSIKRLIDEAAMSSRGDDTLMIQYLKSIDLVGFEPSNPRHQMATEIYLHDMMRIDTALPYLIESNNSRLRMPNGSRDATGIYQETGPERAMYMVHRIAPKPSIYATEEEIVNYHTLVVVATKVPSGKDSLSDVGEVTILPVNHIDSFRSIKQLTI